MARKKNENTEAESVETETAEGRSAFRMSDDATIQFGLDAEGKPYSGENSPKKGDATKARWGIYREGMTVAEAKEAGLTQSHIRKDRRAGFITVTNPEKPAEAETETAEVAESDAAA